VVVLSVYLVYLNRKMEVPGKLINIGYVIFGLIILQMLLGLGMERLNIPGTLQLLHLVSVSILICAEFLFMLIAGFSRKAQVKQAVSVGG
jgi:heme A synthase